MVAGEMDRLQVGWIGCKFRKNLNQSDILEFILTMSR